MTDEKRTCLNCANMEPAIHCTKPNWEHTDSVCNHHASDGFVSFHCDRWKKNDATQVTRLCPVCEQRAREDEGTVRVPEADVRAIVRRLAERECVLVSESDEYERELLACLGLLAHFGLEVRA